MITKEQFGRIDNCQESLDYVASQPSLADAWENCERPDWLLAFARKARIASKEQFVRVAIGEAEAVLHIWTDKYPDDDRPQKAIQVAKDWIADHASGKRADAAANASASASSSSAAYASAAYAAYAAGAYAAYAAAAYAAYAAAYAAYAASDAAYAAASDAAYAAASDASAAVRAAAATAASDDKVAFLRAQCDRIRAIIPNPFIDHEGDKQ